MPSPLGKSTPAVSSSAGAGSPLSGPQIRRVQSDGEAKGIRVRLLIIRHAQSANKQRGGRKATADPELTDLGYEQADALSGRLKKDFTPEVLQKTPLWVVCSPMRRCLLTILPTLKALKLSKDICLCHGSFYEFGCAGKDRRTSTPNDIVYDFPEFTPVGFDSAGQWDYRGSHAKETEQECRDRCIRLADWLHCEAAATLRARSTGKDSPTLLLVIHQSLADLLCQVLTEGDGGKWNYGDITNKLSNAGITEVFLHPDGQATFGRKNDDTHNLFTQLSMRGRRHSHSGASMCPF